MTERICFSSKDADSLSQAVEKALATLKHGGVMLYPTDTVYGLGCDALDVEAIECINNIKSRDTQKPILVLVSDQTMAEKYGVWNDTAKKLANIFLPGPLTILVQKTEVLPDLLTAESPMIGIRVPDNAFCTELVRRLGNPITSTSANISGQQPATTVDEILETLGGNAHDIDLVIEETDRVITSPTPSTLVKVEGEDVTVLREGAISKKAIHSRIFT